MARPQTYTDTTVVRLSSPKNGSRLNRNSDRRAIMNAIMDAGGRMSLKEIDDIIGFDIRSTVIAMIRQGWLEIESETTESKCEA